MTCPAVVKAKTEKKIAYRNSVERDEEKNRLRRRYIMEGNFEIFLRGIGWKIME